MKNDSDNFSFRDRFATNRIDRSDNKRWIHLRGGYVITARFTQKDNCYYLSVDGHACYADKGQDIVCAYVSGLVIAIVNEMQEYGAEITNNEKISTSFIAVQTSQSPIDFHLFRLFKMLLDNLQQIEQQYPDNIKVVVESEV